MTRLAHWESRLVDAERYAQGRRFRYGRWDCALFASYTVFCLTGIDLAADWRETYCTQPDVDVERVCADRLESAGAQEISPGRARRGDIVLRDTELGPSMGVVLSNGRAAFAAVPRGLVRCEILECRRAWSI